jgi:hypothetical protein
MKVLKSSVLGVAVFGFLGLLATAGYASVLAPGSSVSVYSDFSPANFGAVQADTGIQAVTGLDNLNVVTFQGNFRQIVVTDTVTGFLDFLYQIQTTTGPDSIGRVTTNNYSAFITDVGISTGSADLIAPIGPTKFAPASIDRSGSGSTLGFQFAPSSDITAPNESYVLVIKTNATFFTAGSTSVIDGGIDSVSSFAPTAVPEPGCAGVLLVLGGGLLVARRARVVQN